MKADKVIEVLEGLYTGHKVENNAIDQAISLIKELDTERSARQKKDVAYTLLQGKYDAVLKKCKEHKAENGELRKENERLRKRDDSANIELCFNDGFNPFAREDLKIVDVGVADNVYVVESETVTKLQQELTELKEKYEKNKPICSECQSYPQKKSYEDRISDLKKAVASEGLGVDTIATNIYDFLCGKGMSLRLSLDLIREIATSLHEGQTKYKKELLDKAGER